MSLAERIAAMRPRLIEYVSREFPECRNRADDLVQEAIVVVLGLQHRFPADASDASLFAWLRTTLMRRALRVIHGEQHDDANRPRGVSFGSRGHTPEHRILRAIDALPEREQDTITWLYRFDWSIDRIAFELNTTPQAVARLKARAMQRLKRLLKPDDFTSLDSSL
jgi:RNA polymerase sigma factor (sigma-70 family)